MFLFKRTVGIRSKGIEYQLSQQTSSNEFRNFSDCRNLGNIAGERAYRIFVYSPEKEEENISFLAYCHRDARDF